MLVGIVPHQRDLAFLLEHGWYRVPVDTAPKRGWPPRWFAAFEPKGVNGSHQVVQHYGRIESIREVGREELLRGHPLEGRAGRRYFRLGIPSVATLSKPIVATRNRRNPFISTTLRRLLAAETFNDLFNESPLEEKLWAAMKGLAGMEPAVERQYGWPETRQRYWLDFAIFCTGKNIDVETDGDAYHLAEKAVKADKDRNNFMEESGWSVLRYTTDALKDIDRCMDQIAQTISQNGGLAHSGSVPRVVPRHPKNSQGRLL